MNKPYWNRLILKCSGRLGLDIPVPLIEIEDAPSNSSVSFCAVGNKTLGGATYIELMQRSFATDKEALNAGYRLKKAMLLVSLKLNLNLSFGDPRGSTVAPEAGDWESRQGGRARLAGPGFVMYEGNPMQGLQITNARIDMLPNTKAFESALISAFKDAEEISNPQFLALELYTTSQFESSRAAKLITLISALEVLADQKLKPTKVQAAVKELMDVVRKTDLSRSQQNSLLSALGGLKRESKAASCERLVNDNLDVERGTQVATAYKVRSTIVHSGEGIDEEGLQQSCGCIDRILRSLLMEYSGAP